MSFTYALGWTLLHSLWQGLLLMVLAFVALRVIPSRYSSARYAVSTVALALMLVCGISTFVYLSGHPAPAMATAALREGQGNAGMMMAYQTHAKAPSAFDTFYVFIQSHLRLISVLWVIGVMLFSLRIASGFWYLARLRRDAVPVVGTWVDRLRQLGLQMGIDSAVSLAESARIQAPFVVGYIKPLILLPVGMIGGLTIEQLETILLHELSHIRRADYLVNIVQSFIEALFFFNPFVWIVSSMIRTEREHCCDDAVVQHGHALAYAHALAQVESLRLSHTSLAMSLAGDKNQLLKRIKRIMEKSVQNYSVRDRIVPIVLLVVGLGCASWITLKPEPRMLPENTSQTPVTLVAGDTVKPGERSTSYSRREIIRFDNEGKPHKEIIERFDGDEELRGVVVEPIEPIEPLAPLAMPEFDSFGTLFVTVPDFAAVGAPIIMHAPKLDAHQPLPVPPVMMAWSSDSLRPPVMQSFSYDSDEWATFSADFQARFKEQFADFYKKHGDEVDAMMKDVGREFMANVDHAELTQGVNEMARQQVEIAMQQMNVNRQVMEQQREVMARVQEQMDQVRVQQEEIQRQTTEQAYAVDGKMREFQEAVKEEAFKDGYLKKGEAFKKMSWDKHGIIINGKSIKETDKARYNAIIDKFFKEGSTGQIEE